MLQYISEDQRKLFFFFDDTLWVKPNKIMYMSDGCVASIKTGRIYHFADFGVEAEWHFFATSHEKSAGDEAGGTHKRLATTSSLRRI